MMELQYVSSFRMVWHKYKKTYTSGKLLTFSTNSIGYIKKGGVDFLFRGNVIPAKENDLVYIPCGTQYYSVWTGSPEIEFYQISFEFSSKLAFSEHSFEIINDYPQEQLDIMMMEYKSDPMLALGRFYYMLSDIYNKLTVTEKTKFKDIAPAIEYIENNYAEPICIDSLSKLCNISSPALFKNFKALTGVSPISYKHNVIVQHALNLLANTDLSIEEISYRLGFSSPNYFRTVFTKIAKKPPKYFR